MKSVCIGLVFAVVVVLAMGISPQCRAAEMFGPGFAPRPAYSCAPRQQSQPVARNVSVTVPVPQRPAPCLPPMCGPVPYCPPRPAAAPARPMPVRVDISVRPEDCGQRPAVPVAFRDPGFMAPIVGYSVGLLGATIAAPFRVAEMLCPIKARACAPKAPCTPPPCPVNYGPPPCVPMQAPCRPVAVACAPPGPSVAPLPGCARPASCGVNIPPALLAEYQFPQCEPQDLLSGICNLPGRMVNQSRLPGGIGRPMPGAPVPCR
jgi:hypothetical protein